MPICKPDAQPPQLDADGTWRCDAEYELAGATFAWPNGRGPTITPERCEPVKHVETYDNSKITITVKRSGGA